MANAGYNNSIIGTWREANNKLNNPELEDNERALLEATKRNAVATGLMSFGSGVAGIMNGALQAAEIPYPAQQIYDINELSHQGAGNYYDYDQLGADYAHMRGIDTVRAKDIRGMDTMDKVGAVGTSALSGAKAGFEIGGAWGALAGGVIGGLAGVGGVIAGDQKAKREAINLNNQAEIAQQFAQRNFDAAFEDVANRKHRQLQANIVAEGGKITQAAKNRHMTVSDYAKRILARSNNEKYIYTMKKRNQYSAGGTLYNTHGAYFAPDLVKIEAGGSHEENPYGGIQVGVDPMGIPNLVEEGEVIHDDYVFTKRDAPTEKELGDFALPKKYAGKDFAYIADRLGKEAKERSNDAISNNGMGAMLDRLIALQDYRKQKKEEARMRRELKKMSPEELMQLGEAMGMLQAPPQEMPVAERGMQQPMMQPMEQAPVIAAEGGKLAMVFKEGGEEDEPPVGSILSQYFGITPRMQYTNRNIYDGNVVGTSSAVPSLLTGTVPNMSFEGYRGVAGMIPSKVGTSLATPPATTTKSSAAKSGAGASSGRSKGRDMEYTVPYVNILDYLQSQRGEDGNLTPEGQALFDKINSKLKSPLTYDQWYKKAKDGDYGPVHQATYDIAQEWSNGLNDQRKLEPLQRLGYNIEPNFRNTELVRSPEIEQSQYESRLANMQNPETADITGTAEQGYALQPTWPRYAGAGYNLLSGIHNMLQSPDRYQYRRFNPSYAYGDLSLNRLQYNPYDFNLANNQINAMDAATRTQIGNSGLGASAGAALLASNYNNARNLGNAYWQTRLANQQQLANVIGTNNQAEQAEADFDWRRDTYNTGIRNQYGLYNLQNLIQNDYMNKAAESQKWQAVSQSLDAAASDLAGIGRENWNMNMANTNPAFLYYLNPWAGNVGYKQNG